MPIMFFIRHADVFIKLLMAGFILFMFSAIAGDARFTIYGRPWYVYTIWLSWAMMGSAIPSILILYHFSATRSVVGMLFGALAWYAALGLDSGSFLAYHAPIWFGGALLLTSAMATAIHAAFGPFNLKRNYVSSTSSSDDSDDFSSSKKRNSYDTSHGNHEPAFNVDGTPMMGGGFDAHGNTYGVTSHH